MTKITLFTFKICLIINFIPFLLIIDYESQKKDLIANSWYFD